MKKFVFMGLLAGLLSAWLPPVPGKAAEPETGKGGGAGNRGENFLLHRH